MLYGFFGERTFSSGEIARIQRGALAGPVFGKIGLPECARIDAKASVDVFQLAAVLVLTQAMDDQQLVLEKQRLGSDGANATRAEEFGDGDDEVNREDEEVAHTTNATICAILRKTARNTLFGINSRITN